MAGYEGYSKSHSAIQAETEGRFPASIIAKKLGINAELIKTHIISTEWHHTSSWYNSTGYYDLDECVEFFASEEGKALIAQYKKAKTQTSIYNDCKVEWLEWFGTRSHPQCEERLAYGATISIKGQTATITLSDGRSFKKRLSTNGFHYTPEWTSREKEIKLVAKEAKNRMNAIIKRFRNYATGKRFESCDYFEFRDKNQINAERSSFTSISHKKIVEELKSSGESYAVRTVERLEQSKVGDVVRLGLSFGIKVKKRRFFDRL